MQVPFGRGPGQHLRNAIYFDEISAKNLMAANDLSEALLESRTIQFAGKPQCADNTVCGAFRFELLQKPQSLLCRTATDISLALVEE